MEDRIKEIQQAKRVEGRLQQRILEIEQAERETVKQLTIIRTLLAEFRALLEPQPTLKIEPPAE